MTVSDRVRAVDSVSASVTADSVEARGETFDAAVQVSATATIDSSAKVLPRTTSRLTLLGLEVSHEVTITYADLQPDPDAACVIEVLSATGDLLVSGIGDTPADALAQVFEHMLPPSSSEYIDPDDGPASPTDEG